MIIWSEVRAILNGFLLTNKELFTTFGSISTGAFFYAYPFLTMFSSTLCAMYVLNYRKRKRKRKNTKQTFFGESHTMQLSIVFFRNRPIEITVTGCQSILSMLFESCSREGLVLLLYSNCFLIKEQKIMLSNSSSNITSDSRQKPKCARCRNHGIYPVLLKGHRNLCPYRQCRCEDCVLILERRRLATKSGGQTDVICEKQRTRKKHSSNTMQKGEALIHPVMADPPPTSYLSGKGKHFESCVRTLLFGNQNLNLLIIVLRQEEVWLYLKKMCHHEAVTDH